LPERGTRSDRAADREATTRDEAPIAEPKQLGLKFEGQDDLVLADVAPGSVAADAGLRPQDRIISVDGRQIAGQRRFMALLSGMAGRRIPVIIERGGRQYTVNLTPSESSNAPWLGVFLQDNQENERGAKVTHVYPAGPAARAGLREGDVIVKANDQEIQTSADLIATIDGLKPDSKLALTVLRGDREMQATAMLASRDAFVFHYGGREGQGYARQGYDERPSEGSDDAWGNIPPYAMQMEHDRRNAEQHERIEMELRKLQEEVRMLREAIQRK
jgi:S1-C subfamily serine protease